MAVLVSTTINGDTVEFACEPNESLLDVLRDRLGLTGAKEGCGTGDCGACSVTLDGRLVCSCLVLGCEVGGRRIETIEGMAKGADLHPLQKAFLVHNGLQCGICTPGVLVAAKALLEGKPAASEHAKLALQVGAFSDPDKVREVRRKLEQAGLKTYTEENTQCCYALQDKVWVDGPDGAWEIYTVIADADEPGVLELLQKLGRLTEARAQFELSASLAQNQRERELMLERARATLS